VAWGLDHISSREIAEWRAFAQVEPFGELRADWRAAFEMALTANLHRDTKQRKEPYMAKDFLIQFAQPIEQVVDPMARMERMRGAIVMLNTAMGGQDRRKRH
jgi:hypothetical protein